MQNPPFPFSIANNIDTSLGLLVKLKKLGQVPFLREMEHSLLFGQLLEPIFSFKFVGQFF